MQLIKAGMRSRNELLDTCTGLIIFQISGRTLAADIGQIKIILKPGEIETPFQYSFNVPQFIRIDNIIAPLIELHSLLGLKFQPKNEFARIIVADPEDKIFSFPVDRVNEILTIRKGQYVRELTVIPFSDNNILFDLKVDEKQYSLIDLEKILEFLPKGLHLSCI
jgi:chemotaxis signal transduction protein